ncbi:hypothetical protein RJ640_001381 [Escallonia rubra]|uniref:ALOG domain-containing protein n=1 Tax=Escallonia rubra TaxID=112253 RepID=A0AA88R4F8_9ASTE|nr:hypothetical protein RJ640_001381 [Escallonia rubra]
MLPLNVWGSLDALIGRLRVALEENGGKPELTPVQGAQLYLHDSQSKAQGGQLREEEAEAADSAAAAATASTVAASELRISTFSRSGLLKGRGRETSR